MQEKATMWTAQLIVCGLFILIGVLYLAGNFGLPTIREFVNLFWPLSLIATGVYGLLLHNWRERER
jgi:hypothetical protein